jgi:hypothetical protein
MSVGGARWSGERAGTSEKAMKKRRKKKKGRTSGSWRCGC